MMIKNFIVFHTSGVQQQIQVEQFVIKAKLWHIKH